MNNSNQITPEYKKKVNALKPLIRGSHEIIADKAGVSVFTVRAVLAFKFFNEDVIKEADKIARQLTKVYTNV